MLVDTSSVAQDDVTASHFDLVLEADFARKELRGSVTHTVTVSKDDASHVHFDASKSVRVDAVIDVDSEKSLTFEVKPAPLGNEVVVTLPPGTAAKDMKLRIRLEYATSSAASGVQWLLPEQTAGKTHPYLFTQCQAIHARSVMPCQDTPANKCTYTAAITVPKPLTALMSAESDGSKSAGDKTTFLFRQEVPIPSYLLALVVGKLEGRDLGPRCKVWSEKELIDKCAWEFENVEKQLSAAEELMGPYIWKRYDLLVLPPSFPYGGMENPMLTFVTPTLLAGDRSLVSVIVHEIVHSWTGNLVTSKTWEHFWLNEGFTVFCERKIVGRLEGEATRQMMHISGLKALADSVEVFGKDNPFTALRPKIDIGVDPDDAFSRVPYEKGSNFLYYLETKLGGAEKMDAFLKAYIKRFSYKSITTSDFQDFVYEHFADQKDILDQVEWESWYSMPGMPLITNTYDESLLASANQLAESWIKDADAAAAKASPQDCEKMDSNQICAFLDRLLEAAPMSSTAIEAMRMYKLGESGNTEIRFRWQRLCLRAGWTAIFPEVVKFLTEQGRMKFVRPLYRELAKCPGGKELAMETFEQHRQQYHNIASTMVAKDLGISSTQP